MTRNTTLARRPLCRAMLPALLLLTAAPFALADPASKAASGAEDKVERGKYLVTVAACHDCHTPWAMGPEGPEPDMSRMLSGHPQTIDISSPPDLAPEDIWVAHTSATNTAWAGPWGISFTANLTPDKDTGIGEWTLGEFVDTIRNGRHRGRGRPILPPMPYPMYRNFTDADLEAIFTFLQSIPAIQNEVPKPVVAGMEAPVESPVAAQ